MINKSKKSIALKYDAKIDAAPYVVVKACNELSDIMLKIAREKGIPEYKDDDLAEALYVLPEGQQISPDLYKAVAEVIAYCYSIKGMD
ncbi:MAG TPA: EscU/YscU/HrcU family type III secretion system export apparatus switch protein [Spirochaetota bacterium]|nr:EscU/YscU/HrcU family type III secretion system export apparatus switch protein [Spirochaetota bacterium]